MTKYITESDITKLIDSNDWNVLYDAIANDRVEHPNKLIINGNNIFHMACIRSQTEFIEKIYNLCYPDLNNSDNEIKILSDRKCTLNTEMANAEGLPGIHLYYRYGGKSKKLLQLPSICSLDSTYGGIIGYLMYSIDLMEVYIDSAQQHNCLKNIDHYSSAIQIRENIYYPLIKKINKLVKNSKHNSKYQIDIDRYLKIIKLLMKNLSNKKAVHYAIYLKSITVLEYLVNEKLLNPSIRNNRKETPLILAVRLGYIDIVATLLEAYEIIKYKDIEDETDSDINNYITGDSSSTINMIDQISGYRIFSDDRPINICISNNRNDILKLLINHLNKYRTKMLYKYYHDETDEYNSTYLHNLLVKINKSIIENIEYDILYPALEYLIKYTDLNQINYIGYSSAQLLFINGIWKLDGVKNMLKGRTIDLVKTDVNKKNIYSYISDSDKEEFMEFTKTIILNINTNYSSLGVETDESDMKEINNIIDVIKTDKLLQKKDYGLFYPTQNNYMIFMLYLKNKYSNLFIPHRVYDSGKKNDQLYTMKMTNYPLSDMQMALNNIELMDHAQYYSYSPHLINWHNINHYTVNPELVTILEELKKQDTNILKRFVMIKILAMLSDSANHSNCVVYDRVKKEAWRFESYGLTDLIEDGGEMDRIIENILEKVFGKITYHAPSSYLSNIKFQLADDEDDIKARNLGDPGGYCLAWCIWFVDVICSNIITDRKVTVNYLMKHYITRERYENMFSDVEPHKDDTKSNLYLEYIRQYGHHLDSEKNRILKQIGVSGSGLYSMVTDSTTISAVIHNMKEDKVEYR
jgi:hypothetical protein